MKKLLFYILFIGIVFAQQDFSLPKYNLEVLPPNKLENASIIMEVAASVNMGKTAFEIKVDNQSAQKYYLDFAKDIRFLDNSPIRFNNRASEAYILPNEQVVFMIYFPEKKLKTQNNYELKIKEFNFLIAYKPLNPELEKLAEKNITIIEYGKDGRLKLQKSGQADVILINNSGQKLYRPYLLTGGTPLEFTALASQYWFLEHPGKIDRESTILLKNKPEQNYQDLDLLERPDKNAGKKLIERAPDAYALNVLPEKARRAETLTIGVFVKDPKKIERMTICFNGRNYALKPKNKNWWEKILDVPINICTGEYDLLVFIKDQNGVKVLTKVIKVVDQ